MKRSTSIAARLREVFLNGHWVANTNYRELISDLSWRQATQQVGNLNTIAALTFHVNYYLAGLLNVFRGGALEIRDRYSFDMPPLRSEDEWEKLVEEFLENAEKFARAVEQMSDETLDGPFVDAKYGSYVRNIEGVIEHGYYHLGQISLIRKLVSAGG